MSTTGVILIVEGLLLALALLFIVALLRSHAEILRRLGGLEARAGDPGASAESLLDGSPGGGVAHDLVGETLSGDGRKIAVHSSAAGLTLLAFLSSGCTSCGPIWAALRDGARVPDGSRLVIVTKGRERESPGRIDELAPAGVELIMSTGAWNDYEVPATPHFVLVDGAAGEIAGRGSAGSWEQLVQLVEQAGADLAHAGGRPGTGAPGLGGSGTADRAARAERALTGAGITPGHPSLYPSRHPDEAA